MKGMASAAEGGGDPLLIPQETAAAEAVADEDQPYALSLLRSSCDSCWKKKCKCSGEMPCSRCRRGGVQCTYSTKRKLGRPRGLAATAKLQAQQACEAKRIRKDNDGDTSEGAVSSAQQFSASPVTGLGGLAESRFLSCFLEHFTPMFPVANEVSIRDGLMHSFAGMWYGGAPALRGQEAFRGRALECAFFSSVAIGGLLSGYPVDMVKNHVESAQSSVVEFRGLADKHAVSALILSGMMNILLPPGTEVGAVGGGGGAGTGAGASGANAEGRRSLDEAETIFESMPEKDPLVGVILSFRRMVEGLAAVDPAVLCPSPPSLSRSSSSSTTSTSTCSSASSSAAGKKPRGGGGPTATAPKVAAPKASTPADPPAVGAEGDGKASGGGSKDAAAPSSSPSVLEGAALTEEGRAILSGADVARGDNNKPVQLAQPAHPSFVASDALLLSIRFMREEGAGGLSQLRHVHDFVASELNRLVPARAGALVLISLAGTLLAIKTRLQLTDGMLPMAELTTAMLAKCPGWGRSYGRHAAHLSLAVFRLHGHREAYNTLRALVLKTSDDAVPAFDDLGGQGHVCGLGVCKALCESLLSLTLSDSCDDVARSGTGGGGVSSGSGSGSSSGATRKTGRKRPETPASSPRGGSSGGVTKKPRQSPRSASARKPQQQQQPRATPDKPEVHNTGAAVAPGGSAARTKLSEQAESVSAAVRAVVASDAGAAAWKLPLKRKKSTAASTSAAPPAAVPAPASAAAVVTSSPTAASCFATASTGSSSPSSADVAAAAAAVASETANAVAAATTTTSIAPSPRSPGQPNLSASVGVGRFGEAGNASGEAAGMWSAGAWGGARGGDGGGGGGITAGNSEGFPVGSTGMIDKKSGMIDRSHTSAQGHQQDSFLPPLSGSLLRPQTGEHVTGYSSGGGGGGNAAFMSRSSHYAPGALASTVMSHDPRDAFNASFSSSVAANHDHSQQRRVEAAAALTGNNGLNAAVDGGGGGGGSGGSGTGLSPSHRSSVAWWRSDTLPPSSTAAAISAGTAGSSVARGVLPAVAVTSGAWPMQGSAAPAAATSSAGQPMAWGDSNSGSNARNGVPAWFGGGNGAGPITLPPPDRNGSGRDWAGAPGGGGGGGRHHTHSFPAGPAVAQRWQQGPVEGGSVGNGPFGGAGFAAKLLGPKHTRGGSGFRLAGAPHVVDTGAHPRRQAGRGGNEFDFVYELGMLLDEDEFPGVSQQLGR